MPNDLPDPIGDADLDRWLWRDEIALWKAQPETWLEGDVCVPGEWNIRLILCRIANQRKEHEADRAEMVRELARLSKLEWKFPHKLDVEPDGSLWQHDDVGMRKCSREDVVAWLNRFGEAERELARLRDEAGRIKAAYAKAISDWHATEMELAKCRVELLTALAPAPLPGRPECADSGSEP